ncbi:hypothetical protein RND71_009201 [Anisodus tanguticus]|uniref:Uncharacterized protein n=1 Tax=Anisodus tanguticus TaxID=243964 RepID=A0AAE1SJ52_9SOLA|nr:hypothetical protein RND71_009201 [Anisodus tanguticus]
MEGVGARFGRSSTRYCPTTVFTGPVRRWKKKWIHVSSVKKTTATNGGVSGNNNGSHLMFLKWTPITVSQNNSNSSSADKDGDSESNDSNDVISIEEPRKRKFKYIPISLLEDQKNEISDQDEDEAKPMEADANTGEPTSQDDDCDEKPDINDVLMEENQNEDFDVDKGSSGHPLLVYQDPEDKPPERQDLNESTLDLSLGFTAHEENDADSKRIRRKTANWTE